VRDEQSRLKTRRAGELGAPDEEREVGADDRDRHHHAVGNREPHPGEQVVGQRVAAEALQDRQPEHGQSDEVIDVAGLAEGGGEEDPHEVDDDRGDEHERRPVMGLAQKQAGGDVEGEPDG
jgi:hypothetical protein